MSVTTPKQAIIEVIDAYFEGEQSALYSLRLRSGTMLVGSPMERRGDVLEFAELLNSLSRPADPEGPYRFFEDEMLDLNEVVGIRFIKHFS